MVTLSTWWACQVRGTVAHRGETPRPDAAAARLGTDSAGVAGGSKDTDSPAIAASWKRPRAAQKWRAGGGGGARSRGGPTPAALLDGPAVAAVEGGGLGSSDGPHPDRSECRPPAAAARGPVVLGIGYGPARPLLIGPGQAGAAAGCTKLFLWGVQVGGHGLGNGATSSISGGGGLHVATPLLSSPPLASKPQND